MSHLRFCYTFTYTTSDLRSELILWSRRVHEEPCVELLMQFSAVRSVDERMHI